MSGALVGGIAFFQRSVSGAIPIMITLPGTALIKLLEVGLINVDIILGRVQITLRYLLGE